MKLNIAAVVNCDGATLNIDDCFDVGNFEFLGRDYSFPQPVKVFGEVRNIGSALEISLGVDGEFITLCDRCGQDMSAHVTNELKEDLTDANSEIDGEMFQLNGNVLDITGAVESLLYSGLPMVSLCREDCKGLCPKCGANLNETVCNCDTTRYDPRFAIFRKLSGNSEV